MIRPTSIAIGLSTVLYVASSAAMAQNAPPSYEADPSVYKIIFEDQNFRVIEANRKAGVRDKDHSHPAGSVGYNLTDCTSKIHTPDGKVRDSVNKAGTAHTIAPVASHSAENVGSSECRELIVERK